MEYYQFTFEALKADEKDMLIALLSHAGFSGFEEGEESLKAFVSEVDFDPEAFDTVTAAGFNSYIKTSIKEINWNEQWESGFEPVTIIDPASQIPVVHIRAGFHPVNTSVKYDLEITPKMSFGTGHHDTTCLVIEQMIGLDFKDKTVIDYGTGTGVLAILAEKLGAATILAIDNDKWSIENAEENVSRNDCNKVKLKQDDTIPAGSKADIILANINLNIILASLDAIQAAARPGAVVLFSGIMVHDEPIIMLALTERGIGVQEHFSRNNWLIIRAKL
ncbi:MAG: 50S ribosomal protein L11 methyltransferase [Ferruginibacter sp.]